MKKFYLTYKDGSTLWNQLSWSHNLLIMNIDDEDKRYNCKIFVLNDNKNLFASKYQLYLSTEEELAREIEKQK